MNLMKDVLLRVNPVFKKLKMRKKIIKCLIENLIAEEEIEMKKNYETNKVNNPKM